MSDYRIKITDDSLIGYDRLGELRVAFGKGFTTFTSPSINLGPSDPGRITSGNEQMNPLGRHVPSTVVSPQPTWVFSLPNVALAIEMIAAIVAIVDEIQDNIEQEDSVLGVPAKIKSYQIVNFEDYIPEIQP